MSLSNPRRKIDEQTIEQIESGKRFKTIDDLARRAGFDEDALAYTEFCLMPFFELIVEECAKIAEKQSSAYTGEFNESAGCYGAANAIRNFGKKIGNLSDE